MSSHGGLSWSSQSNGSTSFSDESGRNKDKSSWVEPAYDAFLCPLTKSVMSDPVTLETEQTFERSAIERWFEECRINGRRPVCPMTGKELQSTALKPSIALRQTIEEWTIRNEQARIDNAVATLASDSPEEVFITLSELQTLFSKNKFNKRKARLAGLIPVIVSCLKSEDRVRCLALATLRILAEDDDDNKDAIGETDAIRNCIKCLARDLSKEREEAVCLLYELSTSQQLCEKIVSMTGAILMLVKTVSSNSDNVITVQKADQTLDNLERCEQSVRQMAENGRLHPLLRRLAEGTEEVRLELATILSELVLSSEGKAIAAEMGARTLVVMLQGGQLSGREAALKCLLQLSSLESNGKTLVEAGILTPLIKDLFAVGINQLPMKLKEVSATTLANIVSSGVDLESIPIDAEGNTILSEAIIHNLLHLVSNTGPAIETKLLQVLVGLTSSPAAVDRVVMAIKSAGAIISLIQFLEAPQKDLRANSVKLLYYLSSNMGQELADGLRITTGQLGTLVRIIGAEGVTEEQAAASKLIANLPLEDMQLTRALMDEGTVAIAVRKLEDLRQNVVRIGAARHLSTYREGLVTILLRFTQVSLDENLVNCAREYSLTTFFTELLNLEEAQRVSALALANLSSYSKNLSIMPDIGQSPSCCPFLFKPPPKPTGLCPLHGGRCSAKETFCIYEARAIDALVTILEHSNTSVVEASLKALSTVLLDSESFVEGIKVLSAANGINPILDILKDYKTEQLRQLAVSVVECILRDEEIARQISTNATVHTALVEAFKHGNNVTKQTAEKALKHLNKIPNFSGVFNSKAK